MSDDLKTRADARLEAALETADLRDPRPLYRPVLRHLRARDAAAFERAIRHFDEALVPAVAGDADPVDAWLDFGQRLAEELGAGRLLRVDDSGRAESVDSPVSAGGGLVLFLPDDAATPTLVLRYPRDARPAQRATVELLAEGRVTASAYGV